MKNFLLELGVEEIPAGYIKDAIEKIKKHFVELFKQNKLSYDNVKIFSSPKRFAILFTNLLEQQADETIERNGPAKHIAMDDEGNFTKAGLGFLKKAGVSPDDTFLKETKKGIYIAFKKFIKGKSAEEIIRTTMTELIGKISFPKAMRWGSKKLMFARPLRSICTMLDCDIIDIEIEGIKSSRILTGNRFLGVGTTIELDDAKNYAETLKKVKVIVDREERKQLISKQLNELFINKQKNIITDAKLLDLVCDLVEYPTCVIGSFDEKYLELPEKIITSTLSQHQKYFSVKDDEGKLVNEFVFVSNGNSEYSDIIRKGNEKVIIARLDDASFFWKEDTAKPFEAYVEKLSEVTFEASLGSILQKTNRVCKIVEKISSLVNIKESKTILRTALLAKADLVTLMLGEKEFTKLQGYMGMKYAEKSNEDANVALGIYEHYQPRGKNDGLPTTVEGKIVAIADKLDTVCGICAVGKLPSGSQDPFALRRAANGVVQIIENSKFDINVFELIDFAFSLLDEQFGKTAENKDFVTDYFVQRIKWLMQENKLAYDVIDSVMQVNFESINDLIAKAKALSTFRNDDNFIKLVSGFKRVSNIIAKANPGLEIDENLLAEAAEKQLYTNLIELKANFLPALECKNYNKAFGLLVDYSSSIDLFFDEVLVNCDDEKIKQNRLNLLFNIRSLFIKIADIAKIVIDG